MLTVSDAADLLGVHANTVRAWTDQGILTCLRINQRGDRRYRQHDLDRFLSQAVEARNGLQSNGGSRHGGRPGKAAAGETDATAQARRATALTDALARIGASAKDIEQLLTSTARALCEVGGYTAAALAGPTEAQAAVVGRVRPDARLVEHAVASGQPLVSRIHRPEITYRAALPLPSGSHQWQAIVLSGSKETRTPDEPAVLRAVTAQLATTIRMLDRVAEETEARRRAELVMAMTSDIGAQLDLPRVLEHLVDRAMELFGADHAGIFSREPDGSFKVRATRNLSADYRQTIEHLATRPVSQRAFDERRVVSIPDYPNDPRSVEMRHATVREGINTVTAAPMLSNNEPLGILALYHDTRFELSRDQQSLLEQLAHAAATMLRNAQNFNQMATWAAQLQSIQQLGSRLTRLRSVAEIGNAICAELNQLIDYHNVRVYRVAGEDCVPVAWRGEIGEYEDEDGDQLRLKVGEGITGWVARHGVAQNLPDAANDKRAETIPGTDDDLDESLLLAPMLYEDEVIGVIVLAKLGLSQFTSDDLRLLEIYASIAAQAMANADSTEKMSAQSAALERQLDSQRELLRVTESLLSTLDTQQLLNEIADSLRKLLPYDNICVSIHDQPARMLRPIFARGVHAADYLARPTPDDEGEDGYVMRTGEPILIADELTDPRVDHFESTGPIAGSMIVSPLRSRDNARGVLTIERLGENVSFTQDEFELAKLFAAHVAIALQNAEVHRQVEIRAETDRLTGLWNHGSLMEQIEQLVGGVTRFSMLMVDLDFFKRYNDRFGHQAGNVMLQRIADVLRSSCRDSDRVFRYGGDEFALLLPDTGLAGARTVGAKILQAVNAIGEDDPSAALINCSIGIAVFPRDGADAAAIILAADRACYAAKRGGRARMATANEGLALAAEFQPTQPNLPELEIAAERSLTAA